MLEIARQKFRAGEKVEFRPADATALPFDDGAFDTLVCQFGVMFFPDKDKAYREANRVLTSGGRYYFNVWDSFEFNPFARISHETIGSFFKQDAPIFYTVPFGYHRIDAIKASLAAAEFEDIAVHVLKIDKTIPKARQFAAGLDLRQSDHRGDLRARGRRSGCDRRRHDGGAAARFRPRPRPHAAAGDRVQRTQAVNP